MRWIANETNKKFTNVRAAHEETLSHLCVFIAYTRSTTYYFEIWNDVDKTAHLTKRSMWHTNGEGTDREYINTFFRDIRIHLITAGRQVAMHGVPVHNMAN